MRRSSARRPRSPSARMRNGDTVSSTVVIAWAIATVLLTASPFLMRALGDRGLRALERLMGMLLVLLATQMLLNGVREFVESL